MEKNNTPIPQEKNNLAPLIKNYSPISFHPTNDDNDDDYLG